MTGWVGFIFKNLVIYKLLHVHEWFRSLKYFYLHNQYIFMCHGNWLNRFRSVRRPAGGRLFNRDQCFTSSLRPFQPGDQKEVRGVHGPPRSPKTQLSSVSASNVQHVNIKRGEKIPHLIPFCKDFTCKKKSHFLADSSLWNRSQESCFWFMLNCTLNTEQYSCPFFSFLLHYFTFTYSELIHTTTHPGHDAFMPSCSQ